MTPGKRPASWRQAVERADQIAAFRHHLADSWDGRAIRGVLSVTLAGLQDRPVADVDVGSVVWRLGQGPAMARQPADSLGLAAAYAPRAETAGPCGCV